MEVIARVQVRGVLLYISESSAIRTVLELYGVPELLIEAIIRKHFGVRSYATWTN